MSLYLIFDFEFLSTTYKIIPITINAIAIINIWVFICDVLNTPDKISINFPDNLSSTKHAIPVGIVAITIYQNIFPSVDFFFFTT